MGKVQQLQKAKLYLEMLACSMDPTTQKFVESEVLQKKEIKDILMYVSSVIEDLIGNNGEVINVSKPMSFQVSRLNKHIIMLSDEPIQLSGLITRINKQIDTKYMRKLGASKISKWLIENGYLTNEKISVVKEISQLTITDNAESFGIVMDNKVDIKTGEIKPCLLLTRKAQEYIVDNLETILGEDVENISNEVAKKPDYSMRGQPWSNEEEDKLILEYNEHKLSISEIAKLHNRNNGGISARLKKLGLIE
ncbi:MAG TPA: hypothetical protein DDW54_03465 [Clostridiales bacterium]|nr:hypothetical protein [Clostridiales bacterium]